MHFQHLRQQRKHSAVLKKLEQSIIVANRAALTKAISDATTLIGSKKVAAANGNVPKGAKDYFQILITVAEKVNENVAASQSEVDAQVAALATATTTFNNWKQNMHLIEMFLKGAKDAFLKVQKW